MGSGWTPQNERQPRVVKKNNGKRSANYIRPPKALGRGGRHKKTQEENPAPGESVQTSAERHSENWRRAQGDEEKG
eukprot:5698904-Pyramimonas_sp.AAC.1